MLIDVVFDVEWVYSVHQASIISSRALFGR
jgi:hypothetical protein